jgi:hypothetical protein
MVYFGYSYIFVVDQVGDTKAATAEMVRLQPRWADLQRLLLVHGLCNELIRTGTNGCKMDRAEVTIQTTPDQIELLSHAERPMCDQNNSYDNKKYMLNDGNQQAFTI